MPTESSFLKTLMTRYADQFGNSTSLVGEDDTTRNDESLQDGGAELKQEIEQNSRVIIDEFRRLVAAQDSSLEINRLGPILMKFAPDDLSGQFLVECVELIRQEELKPSAVDQLISVVGLAPRRALSTLFDKIQVLVESKADEDTWFRCLELLPIIIPLLEKPPLNTDDLDYETNDDYKSLVKDIFLNVDYKKPISISILSVVGELNLQANDLAEILNKALEMFTNIAPNDLPSFCYYALLAARRCPAECGGVFNQILTMTTQFEEQNRKYSKTRPVLGTILLHLTLAVRQDASLLKEVIRLARTPPLRFLHSIFFASFLLALSASPSYSDSIYPCLRNHILRHLKFSDRCSQALWVSKLGDSVGGVLPITEVLLVAAKQSYTDTIAESVVHFAFFMLDGLTGAMTLSPVPSRACHHAVSLITQAFTSTEAAQEPILSLLFERLLSSGSASPIRGRFLLDIVRQLVTKGPQFLMAHSAKLRQLIDYLPSFPLETAEDLIKTLMLLFRVNISLRDALLLLLRKLLFSRKLEHRLLAAKGYIQFLLNFKVVGGLASTQSGASSSFSASQLANVCESGRKTGDRVQNPANRTGNDALCIEILGILKRCLEQQAEVRCAVYQSLPQVLHNNSQLVDPVLELLSNQLRDYSVELAEGEKVKKGGEVPVLFAKCLKNNGALLVEPIADLMFCLNRCLAEAERIEAEARPEICAMLRDKLSQLAERMLYANIHELLPEKADPEADSTRCRLVVCTMAAFLETVYSEHQAGEEGDMFNLTGVVAPTQAVTSRSKRTQKVLAFFMNMIRICEAIPTPQTLLGKKKTAGGKKPGDKSKKKDGDKKKGDGFTGRLATLTTLLAKYSSTNFTDLGFVERFLGDLFKAFDGQAGSDRVTHGERGHGAFMITLTFLMQSAAKCQFTETKRLTESAYRLAHIAMAVVKGEHDGDLSEDGRQFSGAALDFLQTVFNQLVRGASSKNQQQQQPNAAASMRNLLSELNSSAEENENTLRLGFIGEFFHLLRSRVREDGEQTNTTRDNAANREFSTLLCLIKSISACSCEDGDENDDENMSQSAVRACSEIKKLCAENEFKRLSSCRCGFEFLLESCYRSDAKYRSFLIDITEDIVSKLGRAISEEASDAGAPARGFLACVTPKTAISCAITPLLHHVELELNDANFVLELIRLWLLSGNDNPNASMNPANPGQKVPKIRDIFWRAVFEHQYALVVTMRNILDSGFDSQQVLLNALKTLAKLYDSLWRSTRIVQSSLLAAFAKEKAIGWVPNGFKELVKATGSEFQSIVYLAIQRFQELGREAVRKKVEAKKKKTAKKKEEDKMGVDEDEEEEEEEAEEQQRSVTPRSGSSSLETRLLPSLIYAIEQYELMILRLSKRKGLNGLGANMKRSTVHDFRITSLETEEKSPTKRTQGAKSQKKTPAKTNKATQEASSGRRRSRAQYDGGEEDEEEGRPPSKTPKTNKKSQKDRSADRRQPLSAHRQGSGDYDDEEDEESDRIGRPPPTTGKKATRKLLASQSSQPY